MRSDMLMHLEVRILESNNVPYDTISRRSRTVRIMYDERQCLHNKICPM